MILSSPEHPIGYIPTFPPRKTEKHFIESTNSHLNEEEKKSLDGNLTSREVYENPLLAIPAEKPHLIKT